MRKIGWTLLAAVALVAPSALAQNVKESCADASERGQRLADSGKLLEARNAFIYCSQDSCPGAVRRDCQAQLDDVKKKIPSLVVRVKDKDGSDVAQGEVSLDNVKIGVLDGRDLEMDPGAHALRIVLPDGRSFDRTIVVAPGERGRAVTFADAPAPVTVERQAPPGRSWTTTRWLGLSAMITGGVALVFGGIFLGLDQSNISAAGTPDVAQCPIQDATSTCVRALDAAKTDLMLALIGGIAGAVLIAGGAVLFALGGTKPRATASALHVTPAIGPHFAGLSLGAAF